MITVVENLENLFIAVGDNLGNVRLIDLYDSNNTIVLNININYQTVDSIIDIKVPSSSYFQNST